jgi:helicase
MVAHGVDEQVVTLTFIDGVGGTLARRLRDAGITDIEDLANADAADVVAVRGVSASRAARWIADATAKFKTMSAFSMREVGQKTETASGSWNAIADPYRLRRALDLKVRCCGNQFTVTGGLEPHRVSRAAAGFACDCADFGKGHTCKHVLAVRLHCKDSELLPLVERLSSESQAGELDLFRLWFDGGKH